MANPDRKSIGYFLTKVLPVSLICFAGGAPVILDRLNSQPRQASVIPTRNSESTPRPTNSDGTTIITDSTPTPLTRIENTTTPRATNPVSTAEATPGRRQGTNEPGTAIDTGSRVTKKYTPTRVE